MYQFYVTIHAEPPGAARGEPIQVADQEVTPLVIDPASLAATPLEVSFEAAVATLETFERMFVEGDGSLVWTSSHGEEAWQVDGNLYDRDGRLLFVDLKGTCPPQQFEQFLAALGWPQIRLMFQLTREAVFLDEAEFRRYAARA